MKNYEKMIECLTYLGELEKANPNRFSGGLAGAIELMLIFRFAEMPPEYYKLEGKELIDFILSTMPTERTLV